jgi:hypothetical protein
MIVCINLQALKTGKSDRSGTRVGKMPLLADFQFFNTRRLTELYEREHMAEQHKNLMAHKEAQLRQQVMSMNRARLDGALDPAVVHSVMRSWLDRSY